MKRIHFSTQINATKEKIWAVLWNDETYRTWTSVFCEGSYAESKWNEGDKILFLTPSGNGMFSIIAKKIPNEYMSFEHFGNVIDGKEQPIDEETEKWTGAQENYTLKEKDGHAELSVDMDITEEHEGYFLKAFPKGLQKIKELSEN
ncbi:MAG TPA: hypothetical protein VK623_10355 [Flavobacterium sp.]|nr:hypothetical protein [Flavobacterium sp.]